MNDEQSFLQDLFRGFYSKNPVQSVPEVEKREFGVGEFGKKITARHLAFKSNREFNDFLKQEAPFFVSFSCAYYSFPAAKPMEAKGFLGSDLVYEFDADDLATDCKQDHDTWSCSCGATGRGSAKNCTNCGNFVQVDQWVCKECLLEVKKQVFRLSDILFQELGLSEGIYFNFSGFKGFHLHIRSDSVKKLSPRARVELVDYLTATGLNPEMLGFFYSDKKFLCPKPADAIGWNKRIINRLKEFFTVLSDEEFSVSAGVSFSSAKKILADKKKFLDSIDSGVLLQPAGSKAKSFWPSLVGRAVEFEKLGIDRQTSVDSKKILRVPDSLHGSTGLLAKTLSLEELKPFSPLDQAIVFSGQPIKLKSVNAPRFYLGEKFWGPFADAEIELPEFVAVYLLLRRKAFLAGGLIV